MQYPEVVIGRARVKLALLGVFCVIFLLGILGSLNAPPTLSHNVHAGRGSVLLAFLNMMFNEADVKIWLGWIGVFFFGVGGPVIIIQAMRSQAPIVFYSSGVLIPAMTPSIIPWTGIVRVKLRGDFIWLNLTEETQRETRFNKRYLVSRKTNHVFFPREDFFSVGLLDQKGPFILSLILNYMKENAKGDEKIMT